jgi:hypothetical protein
MRKATGGPPSKPFEPKRCIESVRYPFTGSEMRQLGSDLAHAVREAIKIEADKSVAMANFNSLKKEQEAKCAELSLKYENGYEMRDMECLVYFSQPRPGYKEIVRTDNGESVREEPMTAEEMQAGFDFPGDDGKSKPQ